MPLQNRVSPFGDIIAVAARGTVMGNRGILHDDAKQLGQRRWQHRTWIICQLDFRGRHRAVMAPHRYTELFFLDDAVAIAAGHRPCFECRRNDFLAWQDAWRRARGSAAAPRAAEMDAVLHRDRIDPKTRRPRRWQASLSDLPDGTFVKRGADAWLVLGDRLLCWQPEGYTASIVRPAAEAAIVLTPRASVAALAAGFLPRFHPDADARNM